ncbi:MAG: hypothetical protein ACXVJ7_11725 [Acidimicrobiia bacterium]
MRDALEAFREQTLPRLRDAEGYRGVYVLTTEEGKAALVSLWETEAQAATTDSAFYGEELARFATIFRSPPGRERYEVAYHDVRVDAG